MKKKPFSSKVITGSLLTIVAMLVIGQPVIAQKLKPEEIVAKHLDSIGTAEVRSGLKTFITVGDLTVTYVTQKNPNATGRVVLASSGARSFLGYNLNASDYPGERMVYDGKKATIDNVLPGGRSPLGSFLQANNELLSNGLFGGVLTTNWAIHNLETNRPKLSGGGLKKSGGKEFYVIDYTPRGGGDLNISLFFEKDTFRHARTEYSRISSASIGRTIDESARQFETRFKISEEFSDHKLVDGVTVPQNYILKYVVSGANGTNEIHWTYKLLEYSVNQPLDDATFSNSSK